MDSVMRQLVFIRFGVAQEERRRFLEFWFGERNYRGQDILTVSFLVAVALEQQELLESPILQYAKNWYLKHKDLRADRVRAWVPYHLMQAGHAELAARLAEEVLLSRRRNGSWSNDLRRTVACAYPLALSGIVPFAALEDSVTYILERLSKGLVDEVALQAQALKLFALIEIVPRELIECTSLKLQNEGSIFFSYNKNDKEFVRRLSRDLQALGIRIWVDENEVLPGDRLIQRVEQGIEETQYLGVVLSRASVKSNWVRLELEMAHSKELAENKIRVLPILIEECTIPLSLHGVCQIDFRSGYENGFSQLLRRLAPWAMDEAHNSPPAQDE